MEKLPEIQLDQYPSREIGQLNGLPGGVLRGRGRESELAKERGAESRDAVRFRLRPAFSRILAFARGTLSQNVRPRNILYFAVYWC